MVQEVPKVMLTQCSCGGKGEDDGEDDGDGRCKGEGDG